MFLTLLFHCILGASQARAVPSWVQLCDLKTQYLFVNDDVRTWAEAEAECDLYGGYLTRITNRHEHNCILKYATDSGWHN